MSPSNLSGIERAVQAAGSQAALAAMLTSRSLGKTTVSQQAISNFVKAGHVPLDRARAVAAATGVPVTDLVSAKVRDLFAGMT